MLKCLASRQFPWNQRRSPPTTILGTTVFLWDVSNDTIRTVDAAKQFCCVDIPIPNELAHLKNAQGIQFCNEMMAYSVKSCVFVTKMTMLLNNGRVIIQRFKFREEISAFRFNDASIIAVSARGSIYATSVRFSPRLLHEGDGSEILDFAGNHIGIVVLKKRMGERPTIKTAFHDANRSSCEKGLVKDSTRCEIVKELVIVARKHELCVMDMDLQRLSTLPMSNQFVSWQLLSSSLIAVRMTAETELFQLDETGGLRSKAKYLSGESLSSSYWNGYAMSVETSDEEIRIAVHGPEKDVGDDSEEEEKKDVEMIDAILHEDRVDVPSVDTKQLAQRLNGSVGVHGRAKTCIEPTLEVAVPPEQQARGAVSSSLLKIPNMSIHPRLAEQRASSSGSLSGHPPSPSPMNMQSATSVPPTTVEQHAVPRPTQMPIVIHTGQQSHSSASFGLPQAGPAGPPGPNVQSSASSANVNQNGGNRGRLTASQFDNVLNLVGSLGTQQQVALEKVSLADEHVRASAIDVRSTIVDQTGLLKKAMDMV